MADVTREEHGQQITVSEHSSERDIGPAHINIVSHSQLFYWWPVWAVGFLMAAITWFFGQPEDIGRNPPEMMFHSTSVGLIFTLVLFGVLVVTNVTLRGLATVVAILLIALISVVFALLDWWDDILALIPELTIYMNFGFYITFSILVFVFWALTFFVFDRLTYWRVEAGQITRERLIGGGEKSYDTTGLTFEEFHDDLFRHWIIGMGTGDLKMTIKGAATETHHLPNVLFANSKVTKIQDLIKRKPD